MEADIVIRQIVFMQTDDLDAFARGLKIVLAARKLHMKPVSLAAGMSESGIRDMYRKTTAPSVFNAYQIANVLKLTVDQIIQVGIHGDIAFARRAPEISVAGRVGAGAQVTLVDAYAKGNGLYHVASPPQIGGSSIVAVEVAGNSMEPVYSPGDVLFYTRATHDGILSEDIGRKCVVADTTGHVWVKQVQRGTEPGRFHLISLNPGAQTIWDTQITWAARVRFAVPAELVTRL